MVLQPRIKVIPQGWMGFSGPWGPIDRLINTTVPWQHDKEKKDITRRDVTQQHQVSRDGLGLIFVLHLDQRPKSRKCTEIYLQVNVYLASCNQSNKKLCKCKNHMFFVRAPLLKRLTKTHYQTYLLKWQKTWKTYTFQFKLTKHKICYIHTHNTVS